MDSVSVFVNSEIEINFILTTKPIKTSSRFWLSPRFLAR